MTQDDRLVASLREVAAQVTIESGDSFDLTRYALERLSDDLGIWASACAAVLATGNPVELSAYARDHDEFLTGTRLLACAYSCTNGAKETAVLHRLLAERLAGQTSPVIAAEPAAPCAVDHEAAVPA